MYYAFICDPRNNARIDADVFAIFGVMAFNASIGDIRFLNFGLGVQYEKWKLDYLVGGMWGDNDHGVEHFCLDPGVQFSRSLQPLSSLVTGHDPCVLSSNAVCCRTNNTLGCFVDEQSSQYYEK